MNTLTINNNQVYLLASNFGELLPTQLKKVKEIIAKNLDPELTNIELLLVLFPGNIKLQFQLFRCLLYKIPFLRRFAYGGLNLDNLREMAVFTHFITKPLPPDWPDRMTWSQYCTLAECYKKSQNESSVHYRRFMETLTDFCHPLYKQIPVIKNEALQNELVAEYTRAMQEIALTFPCFFAPTKGKRKTSRFGYMDITDLIANGVVNIAEVEKTQALTVLMHIERKLEAAAQNKKTKS